ncbi:MAG: cell division FtsA domain-containing protein [Patescibacteria group bacterium]|nr:cell division FtsA domain-containing protein [Patescibacteria group bacterium]
MGLFDKFFPQEKQNGNYALALDIGTDLVKALIFEIKPDEQRGYVIGVGRQKQKLSDIHAGAVTDIQGVVRSAEKAIEQAEKMADVKPDQVILGIAGELVKGITTNVHYERKKPKFKIDFPELKNILQKVQWQAFNKVRKQLSWETGLDEIDVKLINAAIVDVRIDGYRIANPIGFQGKDVSISIFNAYAPLVHLGALESISTDLEMDLLSIAAEPYAVASCQDKEDSKEFSAIFIDIGGGTTDVAVVKNGILEGTKMFGLGGRAFTKRLANDLKINFSEAEEIKIKYSKNLLKQDIVKQVKKALDSDCQVWLSGVELALSEFDHIDHLPSEILLCGGGSALLGIKNALQSDSWVKNLPFTKKPKINFLKPDDVTSIVDKTGLLKSQQDVTPMALANLALDLAGEEEPLQGILRKVVNMMHT